MVVMRSGTYRRNSDLEETIGKYKIAYLGLHRKTAIRNAPDVPKFAPWTSLMLELYCNICLSLGQNVLPYDSVVKDNTPCSWCQIKLPKK